MLIVITALIALAFSLSGRYRAQNIVRAACQDASAAGNLARENGDEDYFNAYWSLLIDELEKAAMLDGKYVEVLESAMITWENLGGNDTISGDFQIENFVRVEATCNMLTK